MDETLARSFNEQLDLSSSEPSEPSEDERPVRKALRDLSNENIPFVAVESGHSIMVYTYCRTPDDMRKYVQMFRSGHLHFRINDIFGRLFKMSRPQSLDALQVEVTITEEYKEIMEKITGIDGESTYFFL